MRLDFYKYNSPNQTYFSNFNTYLDKITVNWLPPGGLPIFNEEFIKEDDTTVFKSGDYDLKIALNQTELSEEGATVQEFFTDITEQTLYLCVILLDVNDPATWRAGTMDMNTYNIAYTYSQGELFITFTIIGILKEVEKDLTARIYNTPVSGNITFNAFLDLQFTRGGVNFPEIRINNQLNIASKVGFMPIVHAEFHNIGVLETFEFGYHWSVNRWQVLKDLARELGFFIKCVPYDLGPTRCNFELILYFRDTGLTEATIDVITHNQSYSLTAINKEYIFVRLARIGQTVDEEETAGMFLKKGDYWMLFDIQPSNLGTDYFELDTAENVVRIVGNIGGGFQEETPYSKIYFLNFTAYNNTRYNYNDGFPETFIFSRIFGEIVDGLFSHNYDVIAYALIKPELMRLFTGFKKVKRLQISTANGLNVSLGSVIPVSGVDYICERITDYNTETATAEIEIMEA